MKKQYEPVISTTLSLSCELMMEVMSGNTLQVNLYHINKKQHDKNNNNTEISSCSYVVRGNYLQQFQQVVVSINYCFPT